MIKLRIGTNLSTEEISILKVSWTGNQVFDDFLFTGSSFPGYSVSFALEYIEHNYLLRAADGFFKGYDIDLSTNFIGDEGAEKIVQRFAPYSSFIRTLDLSYNRIHTDGVFKITSGFQNAPSLPVFELKITGNCGANRSNINDNQKTKFAGSLSPENCGIDKSIYIFCL